MLLCCFFIFFFFSSRRRHTRSLRDWSSDVCSSIYEEAERAVDVERLAGEHERQERARHDQRQREQDRDRVEEALELRGEHQIGRASCRERVEISVGGGSGKKKRKIRETRGA